MAGPRKSPKPSRAHATRPKTVEHRKVFLENLAGAHGFETAANITRSCEAAGITRMCFYGWKDDPEFLAAYEIAWQQGYDVMEEICRNRAFSGFLEPVFYKGDIVGHVKKFSDPLAMFLMKGNKAEKFRDRVETISTGGASDSRFHKLTQEELDEEIKRRLG